MYRGATRRRLARISAALPGSASTLLIELGVGLGGVEFCYHAEIIGYDHFAKVGQVAGDDGQVRLDQVEELIGGSVVVVEVNGLVRDDARRRLRRNRPAGRVGAQQE